MATFDEVLTCNPFHHGQLQNGKYYLNGEVLQRTAIKPLFHDFSLSERSFIKEMILSRKGQLLRSMVQKSLCSSSAHTVFTRLSAAPD